MKTLYIYRHADTLAAARGQADHERQLSERGREEAKRMGKWLKLQKINPEKTICSSAARTRATLTLTQESLDAPLPVEYEDKLYLAASGEIVRILNGIKGNPASVMVIGHNPGLHQLCLQLAQKQGKPLDTLAFEFPTGSITRFSIPVPDWKSLSLDSDATLETFVTPATVKLS